jgi:TPP-dependent pyruvate/acetoin dehydrogenase alpha subunit
MTEQKERELYYWLRLIREFEDRVSALDRQGKIQGGVYSGKGQEAVVVGVCHELKPEDWIFPLHRDLGAFLVKGADPNRLMAQIFGKRDGFSKGWGRRTSSRSGRRTAWRSPSSARGRAAGGMCTRR